MSKVSINKAAAELEELTEEERRALRISRFHAEQLHPRAPSSSNEARPRLAHPGGALATNKAAALAKFLKRKLNEPGGAATLDPDLVERAVENAKATAIAGQQPAASSKAAKIRHVDSFSDSDEEGVAQRELNAEHVRTKHKKKKNKSLKSDSRIAPAQIGKSSRKKKKTKKEKKNKKS